MTQEFHPLTTYHVNIRNERVLSPITVCNLNIYLYLSINVDRYRYLGLKKWLKSSKKACYSIRHLSWHNFKSPRNIIKTNYYKYYFKTQYKCPLFSLPLYHFFPILCLHWTLIYLETTLSAGVHSSEGCLFSNRENIQLSFKV